MYESGVSSARQILSTTVKVESSDAALVMQRETVAQRVLTQFGDRLPDLRLLCFLDKEDWQPFRDYAVRGKSCFLHTS